jgi:hypothetical protein
MFAPVLLRSEVAALSQRLAAVAPALAAAIEAAPHWESPEVQQFTAACIATSACVRIGIDLDVKGSDALRVAAAARMLLLAGRAALLAVAGTGAGASAAPHHPSEVRRQLVLGPLLTKQLHAFPGCMVLLDSAAAAGCLLPAAAGAASRHADTGPCACLRAGEDVAPWMHCHLMVGRQGQWRRQQGKRGRAS